MVSLSSSIQVSPLVQPEQGSDIQANSEQGSIDTRSEPPLIPSRFTFKPSQGPKLKPGEGKNIGGPLPVRPKLPSRPPPDSESLGSESSSEEEESQSSYEQGSEADSEESISNISPPVAGIFPRTNPSYHHVHPWR